MSEIVIPQSTGNLDSGLFKQGLKTLGIKRSWLEGFAGAGVFGQFVPKRKEWESGKMATVSEAARRLIEGADHALRIYALNDAGLPRREERRGRLTGVIYSRILRDGPVYGAEVTGITNISVGNDWNRTLPVLSIMEFSAGTPNNQNLVISVPELAYLYQSEQADIEIAQA